MRKHQAPEVVQLGRGFGLIDVVIVMFVIGVLAFIVISNILAHNY